MRNWELKKNYCITLAQVPPTLSANASAQDFLARKSMVPPINTGVTTRAACDSDKLPVKDTCSDSLYAHESGGEGGFNTLRTGLLNCLNARSRDLTFRHRASCILGQAFRYSPENAFYIFNQQIYFII